MICQLRLWIELLKSAYYRDGTDGELETLPNIDINIKCGNSLLSRFRIDQNLSDAFKKANLSVSQYRALVASYKNTKDKNIKREIQTKIDKAKSRFQEEGLGNLMKRLDAEMAALKAEEAQADLFVLGEEQTKVNEAKLLMIRGKIAALEGRKAKLLQEKTFLSAVEWRFEFPEVLDDAGKYLGFDVLIANPPYMRIQEIEATQPLQKEYYERNYTTARGSYDLANLFFELAVRLSKPGGNNNIFIFPHKLFNSENGSSLREYLMNTHAIKHLTHFGANQVFESAITYTCIALFNSAPADTFRFKRFKLGEAFENELASDELYADLAYKDIADASALYGSNQWIFFDDPKGYDCFKSLYEASVPLGEKYGVFVGLQTSRDSLYVAKKVAEDKDHYTIMINPDGKAEEPPITTKTFKVEKTFFRPFLMGKDVHRYQTLGTDRLVFFPYSIDGEANLVQLSELKKSYPLTYAFVTKYKHVFESRENGKAKKLSEYYAYIYEKNLVKFDQDKLTAMEICSSTPNVTVNPNGVYHSTTVYSMVKKAKYDVSNEFLAGVLNSRIFWWFLKSTGDTLQGDARRMKTNYVDPFPLPQVVAPSDMKKISTLVGKVIAENAGMARADIVAKYESEIDEAVFALYKFDSSAVAVVGRALSTFTSAQLAELQSVEVVKH